MIKEVDHVLVDQGKTAEEVAEMLVLVRRRQVAVEEKDYPAQMELQWFIDEQVEEEENTGGVVELLKMAGDNQGALLMLDRELANRSPEEEA